MKKRVFCRIRLLSHDDSFGYSDPFPVLASSQSWADIENSVERDDWLRFGFCSTLDAYILGACHLVRGIKRLSP